MAAVHHAMHQRSFSRIPTERAASDKRISALGPDMCQVPQDTQQPLLLKKLAAATAAQLRVAYCCCCCCTAHLLPPICSMKQSMTSPSSIPNCVNAGHSTEEHLHVREGATARRLPPSP
jgi:hypothetical protein